MISPWKIGETAIYYSPGSMYHNTPVKIMSELQYIIVENMVKIIGMRYTHEIKLMDGRFIFTNKNGDKCAFCAQLYELKRPHDPDEEVVENEEELIV